MSRNIDDDLLIAVLEGRATTEMEKAVEDAIQNEPDLRLRMEELSGAIDWPLGSAQALGNPISESLHTAILKLEQDWDQVLSAHSGQTTLPAESVKDNVFTEIPSVRIVREIGRGGMGVVYEGIDDALERRVAIKQLHPQYYRDIQARERLKREAQAIASLHHPNVVAIYGLQMVGGYPCLIQQFVDGESLQSVIRREGPIPFPQCADVALQIAQGLASAHAAGIIHRDLKPDNVLIEHGTHVARLGDFGLAKRAGEEQVTMEGVVAGTPAYMSPEQTDGKGIDHRSDLFSLGVLLYTMAVGKPPFEGTDPYVVMDAIRNRTHVPLASLSSGIPEWYSRLVDRLLEKDPGKRLASIDQVVEALQKKGFDDVVAPQRWASKGVAFATVAAATLATALISWYGIMSAKREGASNSQTQSVGANPNLPRPAIVTKSDGRSFERLDAAIEHAVDGETIVIARDLESGRIEISGKSIHFEAAPDTRPVLRMRAASDDGSGVFLRSDSDLSLKGLRIECQTSASVPWMEDGKIVSGIYTLQGRKMRIEDCQIHRLAGGVCLGIGGDLEMRRTWIEGGDVGIAWYALDSSCLVEDSVIHSKIGIGVIYPAANIKPTQTSEFFAKRSSLVADVSFDLLLSRIPSIPAAVQFERCIFDGKHAVSLRTTPLLATEIASGDRMIDTATRSLQWKDTQCVYATGMDYLITRRVRTPNRKSSAGIDSVQVWKERYTQIDGNQDTEDSFSIERQIETALPSTLSESPWERPSSLHRFTPELPSSWQENAPPLGG
jgi:serine/threonine protein kinase